MAFPQKISVAMCTYNGESFLYDQLLSIANQTVIPDEIIVVDDGSTDATVSIVNKFIETSHLTVKLYQNNSNLHVIKNFEKAIGLCSGEIIFLSDQDDLWLPEKISEHLKVYGKNPDCGYVFSDAEIFSENVESTGKDLWESIGFDSARRDRYAAGEQLEVMFKGGNFVYGTTMSFRSKYKEILLPIDSISKHFTHDVWISCLLSSIGAHGVGVNNKLIKYRQHRCQVAGAGRKVTFIEKMISIGAKREFVNLSLAGDIYLLRQRVSDLAPFYVHNIRLLDECIRHLNFRSNISSSSLIKKIFYVSIELLSGRYGRFSSSWKSAVRDVIL